MDEKIKQHVIFVEFIVRGASTNESACEDVMEAITPGIFQEHKILSCRELFSDWEISR